MLITGADGRVLYANEAYRAMTEAESQRDIRPLDRVHAGDPDVAEAIYRLSMAAKQGRRGTEEVRVFGRAAGAPGRWLKLRSNPASWPGARDATAWTVSDVTRDRERQENIFQELQHAIDYLDHAPAGFFSLDPSGTVTYMNATLAGLLDRDLGDTNSGRLRLTDLVPPHQTAIFGTLAARPGEVRTETFDVDLLRRDGTSRPVRMLHRISFSADGTPGTSRTLVLDRAPGTDGDATEPLRAAEVRFARFFNNAPMAIATVSKDGKVLRANAPFQRLLPGQAAAGRDLTSGVMEKDRAVLSAALADARSGRAAIPPVDVALSGDATRSARFYVSSVEENRSDDEAGMVFAVETTEQRALESQFSQSQKMNAVGQLAGGIAHDFNNVLTAIIGFSDLLLANHRPTDPSFQDIMNIKQNANRAAGLVRQLLAFSRRQTLRPQVLNLDDTLSELSVLLGRLLGERIKLEVRHGRELWFVKADLNQFEQVVVNLSVNARDAMPDGGRLSIATRNVTPDDIAGQNLPGMPAGEYVLVSVTDTGTGIPPEIVDKIFEPFFSTKEVGKGTGLGLSTVYGIVKQTGGYIFVDSEVGRGTEFRIFLPRHVPAESEIPTKVEVRPQSAPDLTGQGTVLLVEDEEAVRAFAARALSSRGYRVIEAGTGAVALELLRQHKDEIDLVVSDVVMPEMDGPTLLREMRAFAPDMRVVFMSGYAEDAFRKNLDEKEVFAFLPKPFSLKQLAQTVKENMPR
jgi:two-component system, cell cycle sensor histidine kinase and response regulator CckA